MNRSFYALIAFLPLSLLSVAATGQVVPTIDQLIQLETVSSPALSPDAQWVAYRVTEADFEEDARISHLWLMKTDSSIRFQVTRGKESVSPVQWSPDSQWIAFTRRSEGKNQLFVIRPDGGEAIRLSDSKSGVGSFEWSPDGRSIAYTASDSTEEAEKDRKKAYGEFEVVRRDYAYRHIWTLDVQEALKNPSEGLRRTQGTDMSVTSFAWSPDSSKIAFGAAVNPDLVRRDTTDLYVLELSTNSSRKIVSQPGPDDQPLWSPDGSTILFSTVMGRENYYPLNSELATVSVGGGEIRVLTRNFDEDVNAVAWKPAGIYFAALQKTQSHLFRLDPQSLSVSQVSNGGAGMWSSFSLSQDGARMAFTGISPTSLSEIYLSNLPDFRPQRLTNMTDQTSDWVLGTREVISWKSQDGTEIEGVLIKPSDFDPSRKYPLLCVIHGGPTGIDRPGLLLRGTSYYPVDLWAARGALILRVNYRGSAGYGEKFRTLNVRNLGVGDAWDVLSGVDSLVARGWVDPAKVGAMGWSQGGYISAFLTTSSDRFAAISVGAGISNWATYYYNTDITPFTRHYLEADPAEDPDIYLKTSPMTYIRQASTPTLIQHGEFDRRVPIPNAYELRQGLEDRGVPVEMIVYKGFGHGITKPRSMRAVMFHNLSWFNHYIWNDPLPDFRAAPLKEDSDDR